MTPAHWTCLVLMGIAVVYDPTVRNHLRIASRLRRGSRGFLLVLVAGCFLVTAKVVFAAGLPLQSSSQSFFDPSPGRGSSFGSELDVDGNYLAIAMSGSINRPGFARGVFVYDVSTGSLLQTLTVPDQVNNPNYDFGTSVAVSGNLAVVGASYEHVQLPGGSMQFNRGAAYVFDMSTGQQLVRLVPEGPVGDRFFGSTVAIDGDTVAVGAWGAAYLFSASTGQQTAKFSPPTPSDQFGISVALNDDIVLVGDNSDQSRGEFTGAAYVFDRHTHAQLRKIVPADALGATPFVNGDNFGLSVSLDGNHAIIGSPLHSRTNGHRGAAYVFDVTTGEQLAKLSPPSSIAWPSGIGGEVDIQGNLALIGAHNFNFPVGAGAAFLYDWTNEEILFQLVPQDVTSGFGTGSAVAFGEGFAMVGAAGAWGGMPHSGNIISNTDSFNGRAYRFEIVPEPTTAFLVYAALLVFFPIRSKDRRKTNFREPVETNHVC